MVHVCVCVFYSVTPYYLLLTGHLVGFCGTNVNQISTRKSICLLRNIYKLGVAIDSIDYVTGIGNGSRDPIELNEHSKTHSVSKEIN